MATLELMSLPWGADEIIDLLGECFAEVWPGRNWEPNLEAYAVLPLHISGLRRDGVLVGLGMFLLSPDLNLGCDVGVQIALYCRPSPTRAWDYVRVLRHVEASLRGRVALLGGAAKRPPLGDLSPVFRRLGWTEDEVVYRKDLGPGSAPEEVEG